MDPEGGRVPREHENTGKDETPIDHECGCTVCVDYRAEIDRAVENDEYGQLTDAQLADIERHALRSPENQASLGAY
jgi:queuine/archaeosine tRNA-ribosyltransferase